MKLIPAIVIAITAFAAGGISAYLWQRSQTQFVIELSSAGAAAEAEANVGLSVRRLRLLRTKSLSETLPTLERELDNQIVQLEITMNQAPEWQRKHSLQALSRAKDYRSEYPHSPADTEMAAHLAKAFSQAEPKQ
jgi:hypothetical protein